MKKINTKKSKNKNLKPSAPQHKIQTPVVLIQSYVQYVAAISWRNSGMCFIYGKILEISSER